MNMLAEEMDHSDHSFVPTPLPSSEVFDSGQKTTKPTMEEPKGRALNFSLDEHHVENVLSNSTMTQHHDHGDIDLSDVTIGDDDEDMEKLSSKILAATLEPKNASVGKRRLELFETFLHYFGCHPSTIYQTFRVSMASKGRSR